MHKQGYSARLWKFVGKRLRFKLNGERQVEGIVIAADVLMNIALDKAIEINGRERRPLHQIFIRGNSILMWELMDKMVD